MRHALFAIIGAVGGIGVGYGLYALNNTGSRFDFVTWLTNSLMGHSIGAVVWIVLGAVVGTAASLFLLRHKISN